jgi:hypothetical protein
VAEILVTRTRLQFVVQGTRLGEVWVGFGDFNSRKGRWEGRKVGTLMPSESASRPHRSSGCHWTLARGKKGRIGGMAVGRITKGYLTNITDDASPVGLNVHFLGD